MIAVLLGAMAGGLLIIKSVIDRHAPIVAECRVTGDVTASIIDQEQAANATTIAAVAKRLGLADHAVTIALAAALQESKLHNLAYGDRDSLGLFQQRPSQGWGTAAQIMSPNYAATAFFKALARVPNWSAKSVTDAAQAVQHSGAPDAYARWESLARDLAKATTGEIAAGLSCQFEASRPKQPPASPLPALVKELGPANIGATVSASRGWTIASWLVGHAMEFHVTSISFAHRRWTPDGHWRTTATTDTGVQFAQAAAAG
jgi:hypothetical protein